MSPSVDSTPPSPRAHLPPEHPHQRQPTDFEKMARLDGNTAGPVEEIRHGRDDENHSEAGGEGDHAVRTVGSERHEEEGHTQCGRKTSLMARQMDRNLVAGREHLGQVPNDQQDSRPSDGNTDRTIA